MYHKFDYNNTIILPNQTLELTAGDDLAPGTLNSILKQANLKEVK
jgi:predicted RNA binding protein YcfA (HicA-like mRNA interferase family)